MNAELASMLTSFSFWGTLVVVTLIPYSMFIVAYVFQSDNVFKGDVPFWKGQSRAFLPGDLGLAILATTCLQFFGQLPDETRKSWLMIFGSLLAGFVFFLIGRGFFWPKETYGPAWNSPTKRYHDFVMYWLFGAFLVYICVPTWIFISWSDYGWVHIFGIGVALLLWGGGMVIDSTPAGKRRIDTERQHPNTWMPIWRTRRLARQPR